MQQNQKWQGLIVAVVFISLMVILVTGLAQIGTARSSVSGMGGVGADSAAEHRVTLPLIINEQPLKTPDQNQLLVEIQGGSVDLIIGAAMIVIIIVGGVVFGRRRY